MSPVFTIAIPSYKRRFLREAIESCLAQKYPSFEIIVLDDASPENLWEICSSFRDNRLKYFRNDINIGAERVVDNWNKCLELALGRYFICIGDDDRLAPGALETYSNLIKLYPDLYVYHGQAEVIDENGNLKRTLPTRPEFESVYSLIWNRWNYRHQQYVGDFCYRTDALKRVNGYEYLPLAWGSDDITAVKAAAITGIANASAICFQYRENSLSISNSHNQILKMEAVCLEHKWYQSFLSTVPDNPKDIVLYNKIEEQVPDYFKRKKIYTLWSDFRVNRCSVGAWINDRGKYGISIIDILVAFCRAL